MNVAGHKRRPPLHPLEKTLLGVLCTHLLLLPWAFGTRDLWSQTVSAGLSLIEIALALWPRRYRDELAPAGDFNLNPLPRLWPFVPFWLGLALISYIVLQSLNPAWVFQQNAKSWWMQKVPHIEWLPTSVQAPFERFNHWRELVIVGGAWLSVCALWVGVTRRKSLQLLAGLVILNAVVLGIVGFAHRLSGETKVLWIREFKDNVPFSSFVYQNHAGAFFGLVASLSLGLMVWHFFEGRKRMARSTPSAVWGIVTGVLLLAVLGSLSRGAVITACIFAISAGIAFLVIRCATPVPSTTPRIVNVMLALGFLTAMVFVVREVDFDVIGRKFQEMAKLQANEPSVHGRVAARTAAWSMYQDNWLWGVGAGNFQYLFPNYISKFPEEWENGRVFWKHAHIDWLEIPIELGLPGVLLIGAAFGWAWRRFFQWRGWLHPVAVMVFLGSIQTLLHATIDFPFQNVAVMTTWWCLIFLALRWLEIDRLSEEAKAPRA